MPIVRKVSHTERLVVLKTEGDVTYADVLENLKGIGAEHAYPYRKLLDARDGRSAMRADELDAYFALLERTFRWDDFGPYAIIVGPDEGAAHDAFLSRLLTMGTRPIRFFFDPIEAQDWLKSQPVPGNVSGL
jgi:hypothetical protein